MRDIYESALVRLYAHYHFILPRIHDKKKAVEFQNSMGEAIQNYREGRGAEFDMTKNIKGGVELAMQVFTEVLATTQERFTERTGDFFIHKLY